MANKNQKNQARKVRRVNRTRNKLFGTGFRPRLTVYRSNNYIFAQIIDDETGKTLASSGDYKTDSKKAKTKTERAALVGEELAKLAQKAKIERVVFDKGGYAYHGRIKALAEGARKGGLNF